MGLVDKFGAHFSASDSPQRFYLDPETAEGEQARNVYRHHLIEIPCLRAFGLILVAWFVLLHDLYLIPMPAAWTNFWHLLVIYAVYILVSWITLLVFFRRVQKIHLGLFFLFFDIILFLMAIYYSGGEKSWLFFILMVRTADQTRTTWRNTLLFANASTLGYVLLLLYMWYFEQHALSLPAALTKVCFIYASNMYLSFVAKASDYLRNRLNVAIRLSRDLIRQLGAQSKALEASERDYRALIEGSIQGIFIRQKGVIQLANFALARIFGYDSPDVLIGSDCMTLFAQEDRAQLEAYLEAHLKGEQVPEPYEHMGVRRDGTSVWIECLLSCITWRGEPAILVTLQDITARREAEEALRRAHAKLEARVEERTAALQQANEALQESERIFSTVFRWSPLAITLTLFPQGQFLDVNETFLRDMGYTREEVIGRTFGELGVFVNRSDQERIRAELVEHGHVYGQECRFKTRSGRILTCLASSVSIAIGGRSCVVSSVIDITDRKQAEEALRAHEERLRSAMEATQQGWFELNVQTGEVNVSPEYVRIIGYDPAEFKTNLQDWIEHIHPEDRNAVLEAYRECLRNTDTRTMEYRRQTKTGEWKWIRSMGKIVAFDSENKPLRMTGTHADISQIKRAEAALKESEELYRTLVSLSPDGISMTDANGLLTFTSPRAMQMFGESPEDTVFGRSLLHWIAPEEQEKASANMSHLLTVGTVPAAEYTLIKKDGTRFFGEVNAAVIQAPDGSPMRMIIITRDITERKRAEEEREKLQTQLNQAQKMESVGRLAGGVAHDFNNMLGVILGYTELALSGLKPFDPLYENLKQVQGAANRSADLTRQLLAFSRRQTIAPRSMDLNEQTKGMERLLARIIGEDIDLMFKLSEDLWPVYMDPTQIDQIFANLAVNSRDAMPEGGKLTVETANVTFDVDYCKIHPGFTPDDFVMLAVSDTGCGMDKETLGYAFEPFFTTKSEGKGTGLGLATIYGIVKQNNGFVNIYSEPGQGTTVKVYIPRYVGEEKAVTAAEEEVSPGKGWETILLVEDEGQMRQLARTVLERLGYRVLEAPSPGEAIALCETYPDEIHLLLTDVVMPNMNGKELEKRIKLMKPSIRTLFMSGYTTNAIAHRGMLEKGSHFLQKPFSLDALASKVREILEKK